MDLDEVAEELYSLPVDQFTEVRNARANELSAAGAKPSAAQVRKLRKPSQAAWIANGLARRHPKEIEKVLELGKDLRRAQDRGQGSDLRSLSSTRQGLVQRLLRLVADDAKAVGVSIAADTQRQLVATFEAAMANESSGIALKAGRLTEALSHIGFGGVGEPEPSGSTRRVQTKKGRKSGSEQSAGPDPRRDVLDAEKVIAGAQTALDAANAALDQARKHHESAKVRRREVAEELREAERAVKVSSRELERAMAHKKRETEAVRVAKSQLRAAAPQNRSQRTK
jgi:hypothetical protein